jgi:outer membrane protein insertion porin family
VLNKSIKAVLTLFWKFSQVKAQRKSSFQGYILADVVLTNKISFNDQTVVTFAGLVKAKKSQFLEKNK